MNIEAVRAINSPQLGDRRRRRFRPSFLERERVVTGM
jgi:hypothetical protein